MKYVPTFAKGISKSNEFKTIKNSTEQIMNELKHRKSSQHDTLQQLDIAEVQSQQDIKDLTTRIHKHIDNLAKSESAKIASEYKEKKETVKKDMKDIDDQIDATENISKKLNDSMGKNESELFVNIKHWEKTKKEAKQILECQTSIVTPRYRVNTANERSITDVKSLGDFEKFFVAKLNREINVRIACDRKVCDISGVCLLPDASVIIADYDNKNLKHLDMSYRVTSYLAMSTEPFDICYTNNNEVAVTLVNEKKVQFVSIGTIMKKTKSFSVGDFCRGIVYNDGELFICCGDLRNPTNGSIRVYSLSGTALLTIQQDTAGQPIFSVTVYITLSSCGSKIHVLVADNDKGILTIDRMGNLLASYTDPELRSANGICTLENDDMLVCGFHSHNVLHVSRDGKKLGVVLHEDNGIENPQAICYDCVHSRIIVSTCESNTIQLYDIET